MYAEDDHNDDYDDDNDHDRQSWYLIYCLSSFRTSDRYTYVTNVKINKYYYYVLKPLFSGSM